MLCAKKMRNLEHEALKMLLSGSSKKGSVDFASSPFGLGEKKDSLLHTHYMITWESHEATEKAIRLIWSLRATDIHMLLLFSASGHPF